YGITVVLQNDRLAHRLPLRKSRQCEPQLESLWDNRSSSEHSVVILSSVRESGHKRIKEKNLAQLAKETKLSYTILVQATVDRQNKYQMCDRKNTYKLLPTKRDMYTSERPTPITFFEKFDFSSKKKGVSNWYSALSESLKIYKNDPKLTEIKQNYEKGYYKQSINDYFRQSERARTLEEEKTSIDKTLTNKTGNAIRKCIHDLLPEETGDQKFSKKPCLRESNQNINQENNDFCLASSDPDLEYFNAQELLDKKERHKLCYSWENVINQIDFRAVSKDDSYNLSSEFRNFQKSTIEQVKKNPILCYKKDIEKILSLSNIILIENIKPSFLNFSQTIWDQICRRKSPSSLPSVANNLALEYSSMINSFTPLNDIQDAWCNNFSKITGLTDRDKDKFCQTQIIFRNFSKNVNTNNEDTFVHETLHDLLKEIFRDSTFELICESLVSKNRRSNSSDKENYRGEKPDFKVVTNTKEEILFGEVKTKDSRSLLINKDLIKLSNFQSGALDELIKKYANKIGLASFGIWVSGPRIRIYEMDLNYDGMYRMFLMANVVTPMERAQFLSLIPVLEALYNIKDRISEVLEVIVSDTPASSPRSTYVRMPTPPPKLEPSPIKDISPLIKSHSDEEKGITSNPLPEIEHISSQAQRGKSLDSSESSMEPETSTTSLP
ncbi:9743_t:CDS:10, partial [Dentiscutata heterogama]